jgi:hypothetical protein
MDANYVTSKPPFTADIQIFQESHTLTMIKDNGYSGPSINVEGGMVLKLKVTADSLPELRTKISNHVALIE